MTTPKTQTKASAAKRLPPFRMTQRDAQIVAAVAAYRALTSSGIAALFFPSTSGGVSARALERLRLLYIHGYLHRIERPSLMSEGRLPYVYCLAPIGASMLSDGLGIDSEDVRWSTRERPGTSFLTHVLAVADFRIALTKAVEAQGWVIEEFLDDRVLSRTRDYVILERNGSRQRAAVVPDAYVRLRAGDHAYSLMVEIDLGSVTGQASSWDRRDWSRKVRAYLAYYDSGAFERRYQAKGLRILTVTTSQARADNRRKVAEQAGAKSRFWWTHTALVTPESLISQPIWSVATRGDSLFTLTW